MSKKTNTLNMQEVLGRNNHLLSHDTDNIGHTLFSSCIVAWVFGAAGMCLLNRYLANLGAEDT
jgi:hypothetical protein